MRALPPIDCDSALHPSCSAVELARHELSTPGDVSEVPVGEWPRSRGIGRQKPLMLEPQAGKTLECLAG